MAGKIPARCVDPTCKVPLVGSRHGLKADLPPGHALHHGRGLCMASYKRLRRRGELHLYPQIARTPTEVLDTWQALRRPQFDYSTTQIAALLGMSVRGVQNAVIHARRRGDPRAVPGRDTRFKSRRSVHVPTGWQWSEAQLFDLSTLDEGEATA